MKDVEVFFIANLNILDKETYRLYEKGFFPILKKHGGELGRIVIFKFPSEEVAKGWYNDPEYQKLSEYRRKGAPIVSLTMVKGIPPRD